MQIGEVIRKYRKEKDMTQETMAKRLGVTAPAVNKWENGNSYPDITLLAPIARLLGISLDTLLSFREELRTEEIGKIVEDLSGTIMEKGYEAGFSQAKEIIEQYPNCLELLLLTVQILNAGRTMDQKADGERYDEYIAEQFRFLLEKGDESIRKRAADSLFYFYIRKEEYEKAEECLERFSLDNPERKRKKAFLYRKTGRNEEAYRAYEELLFAEVQILGMTFHEMAVMALEDQDRETAVLFTEKTSDLARIFETGAYNEISPWLEIAMTEKDRELTLKTCGALLEKADTVMNFTKSPMYRHMNFKRLKPGLIDKMKEELKKTFREENFDYMKGDPEWEKLIGKEG